MTLLFIYLLTLIFVLAKLFGFIAWSWLAVFYPIIIPFVLLVVLIVAMNVYLYFWG